MISTKNSIKKGAFFTDTLYSKLLLLARHQSDITRSRDAKRE